MGKTKIKTKKGKTGKTLALSQIISIILSIVAFAYILASATPVVSGDGSEIVPCPYPACEGVSTPNPTGLWGSFTNPLGATQGHIFGTGGVGGAVSGVFATASWAMVIYTGVSMIARLFGASPELSHSLGLAAAGGYIAYAVTTAIGQAGSLGGFGALMASTAWIPFGIGIAVAVIIFLLHFIE